MPRSRPSCWPAPAGGQGTYDLIIAAAAGRELKTLQPAVLDLLRLGTHQLLAMRVPQHAAVAAMVDLAAATVGERVTGVINAVLRRVAAVIMTAGWPGSSEGLDDHDRLALRTSHPRWIVDAYADLLPAAELEAALAANNVSPQVSLAIRPGLAEVDELIAAGAEPGLHSPFAARWSGNPADLPAVREGRAGVQDEGSQLVTWGLARADAPVGPWLDLCAGPGGKTALLTGLARAGGGSLVAAEIAPHRAVLVGQAVRAYGDAAPTVIVADGTRPAWRPGSFSRVLADVPCTGLGALRRRPEVAVAAQRDRRRATAPAATRAAGLGHRQHARPAASSRTSPVHRTAGRAPTWSTETLAARSDLEVLDAGTLLPELSAATVGPYLQLWPHRHGTDAMFAAYLRRRARV